jgi:hypothetical protein
MPISQRKLDWNSLRNSRISVSIRPNRWSVDFAICSSTANGAGGVVAPGSVDRGDLLPDSLPLIGLVLVGDTSFGDCLIHYEVRLQVRQQHGADASTGWPVDHWIAGQIDYRHGNRGLPDSGVGIT